MKCRVLALDPSFRNTGWVMFEFTQDSERPLACGVIQTEKADKKIKAYAGDDNHRCASELATALHTVIQVGEPALVVAEAQAGSQNSRAAQLMGMGWGVVSAVCQLSKLVVLQARPKEVKIANCGQATATKEDIQAAVRKRYPELVGMAKRTKLPPGAHEHIWDAASVAVACLEATEVQFLRKMGAQS